MATLALAAVGAVAGSTLLPAGVSFFGATLSGAAIGAQVGALAGSYVDQALFASSGEGRVVQGPRLKDLHVTASTEGAPLPRVLGRVRVGGQVIWATDFEEVVVRSSQSVGGGKGGFGGGSSVEQVQYKYFANFAVAVAAGEITGIGRVWADGQELDLSKFTYRVHVGSSDQQPDSLISTIEGADSAPAFRGVAYIVFERMPLAGFGNRLPQLSFEVIRIEPDVAHSAPAVVVIPGSGEFVYGTEPVRRILAPGVSESENVHGRQGATDWTVSMDQLQTTLPNVRHVSLVVSWFGTDLRAGHCEIRPGVEIADKTTKPWTWRVCGTERSGAHLVSRHDGRAAYGGTPSDQAVIDAIRDLKARGIGVTVTPFVLMDVPADNALADPYGGASQPAYPWRGRITCDPAPGVAGSADKTAAAAQQVAAFAGTAVAGDFSVTGDAVSYSGPAEWSYRRMVLHMAHLAVAAGGVDAFLIGSELRGLTTIRDGDAHFPFVDELTQLAAEVKAVLGPVTKVSYAADWSEYFGYQPHDGSGDVYFHLDGLWASPAIDAVGIDCYWPLADWREGATHADAASGARSIHDLGYLRANLAGGEGYEWYYASEADRAAQVRTPITDGAGKPWVFRYKDIANWWGEAHYDRPGGVESAQPTAWVPRSKPIWFTEIGCPAVDKGANQPNVFVDPKSSENALPHFSTGGRDDFMPRRYLTAFLEHFSEDTGVDYEARNPVSPIYGGRMVDPERLYAYCWDARPFPAFPNATDVWGDAANWSRGHWLNGRITGVSLDRVVGRILTDAGFDRFSADALEGLVPGYVIDNVMSARDALQPLSLGYFFDAVESGPEIRFQHRHGLKPIVDLSAAELVETGRDQAVTTTTRRQETELPASAKIAYVSADGDYEQAVAEARRLTGASGRVSRADLPVVLESHQAGQIAETWLHESWAARESARFELMPSRLALEPGDLVRVTDAAGGDVLRIMEVADRGARRVEAMRLDPAIYGAAVTISRPGGTVAPPVAAGGPDFVLLDLPLLTGGEDANQGYVAAFQKPWPGGVAVYASPDDQGYALRRIVGLPARMGATLDTLEAGVAHRFDPAGAFRIVLAGGELTSLSRLQVLAGANAAALQHADGRWEILQFERAELDAPGIYRLSGLLRGQAGTDAVMRDNAAVPAGARIVLLDDAVTGLALSPDELRLPLNWRVGPADRDIGDDSYETVEHAFAGVAHRPYAPVHLRLHKTGGGFALSWVRPTRKGGDSWESAEVPLGEERELYELEIVSGSQVVRTETLEKPSYFYADLMFDEDFPVTPAEIGVRVAQVNSIWGRGDAAVAVFDPN